MLNFRSLCLKMLLYFQEEFAFGLQKKKISRAYIPRQGLKPLPHFFSRLFPREVGREGRDSVVFLFFFFFLFGEITMQEHSWWQAKAALPSLGKKGVNRWGVEKE